MMYLNDHHCQVLAKLRALISSALQQLYHLRFHHDPPLCLYRVRDFTFLPHLLESGKPSKQITVADLAQKILLTTDANIEEVLNQSIKRLETQTHYDQQRQLLQRHLEDIGTKPGAAPAPKPPEAHQHKPPKEGQEASYASPQQPDSANMANPRPRSPQRTSGAPSSDGQPPTHNTHISCSEPAAMGAAPSGAYPSAVATPCTSTPGLAEGAPNQWWPTTSHSGTYPLTLQIPSTSPANPHGAPSQDSQQAARFSLRPEGRATIQCAAHNYLECWRMDTTSTRWQRQTQSN